MSRQTRRYETVDVGDDHFDSWINPPMSLFVRIADANGPREITAEIDAVVRGHDVTDEEDQPLPIMEIAAPTLLSFMKAYIERVKNLPPR